MPDRTRFHIHLISDATGETVQNLARACLAQFEEIDVQEHFWPLVRTDAALGRALEDIRDNPGFVMFTLVDDHLRARLVSTCAELDVTCLSILDPITARMAEFLGQRTTGRPGGQHALDAEYFHRIDAMNYVLSHDDGQAVETLDQADVVLVGVSRTSKTPTCIYLANRGIKAANVPIIPGCPLPPALTESSRAFVVGLTEDANRLVQIRRNRLQLLAHHQDTDYTDIESVKREVQAARRLFAERGWPVIDVTRRSIEETATAILQLLAQRRSR